MRTTHLGSIVALAVVLGGTLACTPPEDDLVFADELLPEDHDEDGKADGLAPGVSDDMLNGVWDVTLAGAPAEDAVIESWSAIGIRLHLGGASYTLTRTGDTLAADGVTLAIEANERTVLDDVITGTVAGQAVVLERDIEVKGPITLTLPGDRPYRAWLKQVLLPAAQRDRETYFVMHPAKLRTFLQRCELYRSGSWPRKYMKGATPAEQRATFQKMIDAMAYVKATPHALTRNVKFTKAITDSLKDPTQAGLAISTFAMYFSTAAGGAVRIPMGDDGLIYFITDRPVRGARIGLVAMKTPLHGPLASTFGRQLLDLAAMTAADDAVYARAVMEILVRSDARRVKTLSRAGRSALVDWFAVMAIEDYRGVAFENPWLDWGENMTNVQFYGLVARALARPGQVDDGGRPVTAQVVVGGELRPGDPSYADVLNGGNDMREYPDMSRLKVLATSFLRERHPAVVAEVEAAFAGVVPASELGAGDAAQVDVFRFVAAQLYDDQDRMTRLTGAAAERAIDAVVALFTTLAADSAAFEQYLLAHGLTRSNVAAPRSTGF